MSLFRSLLSTSVAAAALLLAGPLSPAVAQQTIPLLHTPMPATAVGDFTLSGQTCQPGVGVSVIVDFTPAEPEPDTSYDLVLGCAEGEQTSIAAAATAAGFDLTPNTGMLCEIDGIEAEPTGCGSWPGAFWSILTSAANNVPNGPTGSAWVDAYVGIDGGPAIVDSALLFQVQPYSEDFFSRTPRLALTDPQLGLAHIFDNSVVNPPTYPAATDADTRAAAGWLGRQLEAQGGLIGGWGPTTELIIALSAAGVGKDVIDDSAAQLFNSGEAYVGSPAAKASKWPAIAKTALTLQIAGLDPTVYPREGGTRNLLLDLRSVLNADGSFGTGDFPYTHTLAVFALARTESGVPQSAVTWLQNRQCTQGSNAGAYGYSGCSGVDVDGTALAVQALLASGVSATDPSVADAVDWIVSVQDVASAGLPYASGAGPNTNSSGLGAQALLAAGQSEAARGVAGFIGSLQLTCDQVLAEGAVVTADDIGAIAYVPDAWDEGVEFGLDPLPVQWLQATSQAILGLGTPAYGQISALGAEAALPAVPDCDTDDGTTTTTSTSATSSTATSGSTSGGSTSGGSTSSAETSSQSTDLNTIEPVTTSPLSTMSVPTTSGPASVTTGQISPVITLVDITVNAGDVLHVTLTGGEAGTTYQVELHSDPVDLGDLTTDRSGDAAARFVIPPTTQSGQHSVVVLRHGTVVAQAPLTVLAVGATSAGTINAPTVPGLAATGPSSVAPLIFVGVALLILGFALAFGIRRRQPGAGSHR